MVAPCFAGNGIVVAGNARFTVITANCIRMEYSETGKFVDAPSMFAANRAARFTGYKLTRSGHTLTIDTGAIKLRYSADGKRFSPGNLRASYQVREWDRYLEAGAGELRQPRRDRYHSGRLERPGRASQRDYFPRRLVSSSTIPEETCLHPTGSKRGRIISARTGISSATVAIIRQR